MTMTTTTTANISVQDLREGDIVAFPEGLAPAILIDRDLRTNPDGETVAVYYLDLSTDKVFVHKYHTSDRLALG
jgi:hypothetical protein